MASESCKILALSCSFKAYHFCIRKGQFKTSGWVYLDQAFPNILNVEPSFPATFSKTTDLVPLTLVIFNNDDN